MVSTPRHFGPTAAEQRVHEQLAARLSSIGFVLPGSITTRSSRCGNKGCRCHADPAHQHGPYLTWTRKYENKTVTRALSAEQLERYQPWFEEHRRLSEITKDLEILSLRAANRIEKWGLPD
jgi:hypothetical protein